MLNGYRFSPAATADMPRVSGAQLIERMRTDRYAFGVDGMARTGEYRVMGWAFTVPGLRPYLWEDAYGNWATMYAPNRTTLRYLAGIRVLRIIELNN